MREGTLKRLLLVALVSALVLPQAAPAPAAAPAPLIVIDPGHGGPYSNANANGLREKTVNLQIALELRRQLLARGYRVVMTRTTDRAVTLSDIPTWNWRTWRWTFERDGHKGLFSGIPRDDLQARVDLPNRLGADLFISIHNNGSANRSARGTETIASGKDALGVRLSQLVHRRIVARTGLRDRGAKKMDLFVCRWTNAPAILVEGAFISNPSDAYRLKQSWFRRRIAVGIAEGVDSWFASTPFRPRLTRTTSTSAGRAGIAVSRSDFPTGAPAAVVARADRWADAPTAPVLAAKLGGPLLWSGASGLSSETASELSRLQPAKVVVVGIDGSFDATAGASIAAALPAGSSVETITAGSRADLAARIAGVMGPSQPARVIIVDENDQGGLLAAAPAAAFAQVPVLLSSRGALTEDGAAALASLSPTAAVLVGPSSVVPTTVAQGARYSRLEGLDMAATAGAANARYYKATAANSLTPVAADPRFGAEYLTAATFAARRAQPLLPVTGRILPVQTRLWITNRRTQISGFHVFDARRSLPLLVDQMLLKADAF